MRDEATKRYETGMPWAEAAWDIALDGFRSWVDTERIVANVANVYRSASGGAVAPDREEIMAAMLRYRHGEGAPRGTTGCCGEG